MRLGNTGGKNKGKKYLKITGNEPITPKNQRKADLFKDWFGKMYERLQIELIAKRTYNEDVLNDTFIRIHEKIIYGGLEIADYKSYFHRAFFTNYVQNNMNTIKIERTFVPDDQAVENIDDSMDEFNELQQRNHLCQEILEHVKNKFSESDYELFELYVKTDDRKYDKLSSLASISYNQTMNIISKIKKNIRRNQHFMQMRQAM